MRVEHYRLLRQRPTRRLAAAREVDPKPRELKPKEPKPKAKAPETERSRFVEPLRLTNAQKQAIVQALKEAHIGDYESRHLYAGAAEYELAAFQQYARFEEVAVPTAPEHRSETSLSGLKLAADELIGQIAQTAADRVAALEQRSSVPDRPLRPGWVTQLRCELLRIARACEHPHEIDQPATTACVWRADPVSTRRFVQSAVRTFEECFDRKAGIEPGSPFRFALDLVTSTAGIRLADLDSLDDRKTGAAR